MKHIRIFETAELAAAIIPTLEYSTLSKIRGESGVKLTRIVPPSPTAIPFYIEDISGSGGKVSIAKNNSYGNQITVEKSLDGENWELLGTTPANSTVAITANIPANGRLYLRSTTGRWCSSTAYYTTIKPSNRCKLGGNIMSLVYGTNFTGNEISFRSTLSFYCLFKNATNIVDASELLMPVTDFTYGERCYMAMFEGCTSLTKAPVLPAPVLPTTAEKCYNNMFNGCTNLNYIKCLATNILGSQCLNSWVTGVSATGTFVKDPNMSGWTTGNNGIPSGWTVEDAA